MKRMRRLLSMLVVVCILCNLSISVNAITSDIHVGAGASAFSSESIIPTNSNYIQMHLAMTYVKFVYYPAGCIPSSYYVYVRFYAFPSSTSPISDAWPIGNSNIAFSQPSTFGYNYYLDNSNGGFGQCIRLRTNSDSNLSFEVIYEWDEV